MAYVHGAHPGVESSAICPLTGHLTESYNFPDLPGLAAMRRTPIKDV